jgi:hypothetical protein
MWWGSDSYWYYMITESIITDGFIGGSSGQFALANPRSNTVVFNLLTVVYSAISGIGSAESLREYFPLVMAIGFFIGALLLYQYYLPRYHAVVAAFVFSMTDMVINESMTYTQYGYFAMLSIFFLISLFVLRGDSDRYFILVITFAITVALSHVMASILLPVWVMLAVIFVLLWNYLPFSKFKSVLSGKRFAGILVVLVIFPIVLVYINYTSVVVYAPDVLSVFTETAQPNNPTVFDYRPAGETVLDYVPAVTKVLFVVLSIPVFIKHLNGHLESTVQTVGLLGATGLIAGSVAFIVNAGALGRVLLIAYVFLVGASAYTLQSFVLRHPTYDTPQTGPSDGSLRTAGVVLLIVLLIVGNVPNGVSLSYVDPSADINQEIYHGVPPIEHEGPTAGAWLSDYTVADQVIISRFFNSPITFYYGDRRRIKLEKLQPPVSGTLLYDSEQRIVVNVSSNRMYSNGRVVLVRGEDLIVQVG